MTSTEFTEALGGTSTRHSSLVVRNWYAAPMVPGTTRKSLVFIILGACLVALAIALNVSWIVINWRAGVLLVLGIIFFLVIIGGLVLNTIFLVREVRRNEQHDAFINAVTHELKTPIASIRLYLETLQRRELPQRQAQGVLRHHARRQRPPARPDRAGPARRPVAPAPAAPVTARPAARWCAKAWTWPACATTCPPRRSPTSSTSTPRRRPR